MNKWEYAESIESSSIVSIEKKYGIFIDGKFQSPNSKKYLQNYFSLNRRSFIISSIRKMKSDINSAVESAKEWSKNMVKTIWYPTRKILI
jgi:hypothetical protein